MVLHTKKKNVNHTSFNLEHFLPNSGHVLLFRLGSLCQGLSNYIGFALTNCTLEKETFIIRKLSLQHGLVFGCELINTRPTQGQDVFLYLLKHSAKI